MSERTEEGRKPDLLRLYKAQDQAAIPNRVATKVA